MAEDPKDLSTKLLDHAGNVAGAATTLATANPVVGLAVKVTIDEALGALRSTRDSHLAKRERDFGSELFLSLPEENRTKAGLDALSESPDFQNAIFQSYRRMMDALDDSVVPSIGRLTAAYANKKPDAFFRGMGRVLEDLTSEELRSLERFLAQVLRGADAVASVAWHRLDNGRTLLVIRSGSNAATKSETEAPDCIKRVFQLLAANGFLRYVASLGPPEAIASSGTHTFDKETAERMQLVLAPRDEK